jgi:hypothetical protein
MKHNNVHQDQNKKPDCGSPLTATAEQCQGTADFAPSPDEVARRAYFNYENGGSQPGHDVQHWLKAESDLLAERAATRVHGFHHHA